MSLTAAALAWQRLELAEAGDLGYNSAVHKHLRRLDRIWIDAPIYFITICTRNRRPVLAQSDTSAILIEEWRTAHGRHGWAIGRYVIMSDHVALLLQARNECKDAV